MAGRPTTLERAFALAEGGLCTTLQDVRDKLAAEGYSVDGQLYGPALRKQLAERMKAAKSNPGR